MDILKSIENALKETSKLNADVLAIEGMSSRFNRHLLNNLGSGFEKFNYLEIGVHKGSTYVSSLYKNNVNEAWAIDDWSQFEDQTPYFLGNCERFGVPTNFINADCFTVDRRKIKDINFYLYDGDHWHNKTAQGLIYFYESLSDEFLYVVDDFDWEGVQLGTKWGIAECNLKIEYENYLRSNIGNNADGWWNGLGIYILKK